MPAIFSDFMYLFPDLPALWILGQLELPEDLLTKSMFFKSFQDLARVVAVGILAYVSLILFLRISGKRTLSKMNAFDFVVTVALGSTLATILLSKDVSLAEGVLALALLIGLQYVIARIAVYSPAFNKVIKSEPVLLYYESQFLQQNMQRERVTEEEVLAAIREQGYYSLASVEAVVLETSGSFSVLTKEENPGESALKNIKS